jgi:hypothetical protein
MRAAGAKHPAPETALRQEHPMAGEAKTRPTNASVLDYIAAISYPGRADDCRALVRLMTRLTKKKPVMWGPSIVGFDRYH